MRPLSILLVDRNPEQREQLASLLRSSGHQVSAQEGWIPGEAAGLKGFDAVLLDLTSPDLDLPALQRAAFPGQGAEPDSLDEAERRHLAVVLRHTAGNKRRAAHLLGISRSTLLNKVRKYGLASLAWWTLVVLALPSLSAQTPPPIPDARVTSGILSFDGHATVGDFVGRTDSVSGQITGGPEISSVRGWVEAPVRTLKTGNGKRDKDLNKSMESEKYPIIRFDLTGATPQGGSRDSIGVSLHGSLAIHGVTRRVNLPATAVFRGSTIRVRSDFPLNLKDYRIGGLSKMLGVLKMSENIEVHVDVLFGSSPPS